MIMMKIDDLKKWRFFFSKFEVHLEIKLECYFLQELRMISRRKNNKRFNKRKVKNALERIY